MRNKSEESFLIFRESTFTAIAVTLASLFCQWANWFVYEKINYAWGFTCDYYHTFSHYLKNRYSISSSWKILF